MPLTYHPELFDARTVEQARKIILTGEGSTTDERWKVETPFICGLSPRPSRSRQSPLSSTTAAASAGWRRS